MISKDRNASLPVFTVSHARQEKVCQEVYDYIIRIKIEKLKEAILHLNHIVRQMLQ